MDVTDRPVLSSLAEVVDMIKGTRISLRPVAESDLEAFQRARTDIETRGAWVPLPRTSLLRLGPRPASEP
jgi:hypothetical protein